MKITDLHENFVYLDEKRIILSDGKRSGKVAVVVGLPGSGKNWAVDNLTDLRDSYRIFDVDFLVEFSKKQNPSLLSKNFGQYLISIESPQAEIFRVGGLPLVLTSVQGTNVFYDYLHEKGLFSKQIENFIKAISGKVLPNIAFVVTLRNDDDTIKSLTRLMSVLGYNKDNFDILFVVSPEAERNDNIEGRSHQRNVDMEYVRSISKQALKNFINILYGRSKLSVLFKRIFIVFNSKNNTSYYGDTDLVSNFSYIKLDKSSKFDPQKIETMIDRHITPEKETAEA